MFAFILAVILGFFRKSKHVTWTGEAARFWQCRSVLLSCWLLLSYCVLSQHSPVPCHTE
jgi:hypothetical protein